MRQADKSIAVWFGVGASPGKPAVLSDRSDPALPAAGVAGVGKRKASKTTKAACDRAISQPQFAYSEAGAFGWSGQLRAA